MLHTDNALFHEIIRAAHDPDPVQAARFRPFADPSASRRLDRKPSRPVTTFDLSRMTARATAFVITLFDRRAIQRHAPVPCC